MVEKINLPLLLLIILLFSLVNVGAYTPSNLFNYQETSILLNKENIQSKFFLSSLPSFSNGNKNISNQFNPLNDERALEINKIIEDNKKDRVNKSFYSKKPVIVILHLDKIYKSCPSHTTAMENNAKLINPREINGFSLRCQDSPLFGRGVVLSCDLSENHFVVNLSIFYLIMLFGGIL